MAEEQVVEQQEVVDTPDSPQLNEQQRIEQEAINRYKESQQSKEEKESGVPEGYNEDGTLQEELIAGKFKSQEDLLQAYQELEKKLGSSDKDPVEQTLEAQEMPDLPTADITKYEQEVVDNGGLSEKSYGELEKIGFSKQQVDNYIQGQKSYADGVRNSIFDSVGGEESYLSLINWVSTNMPEDIINEYNGAVNSLDQPKALRTLEYMKMKHDQASPSEPRRLEGDAPSNGLKPFVDKNEWQKAMTDRLYGKDSKYTNMVDQRYLAARKRGIL